MVLITQGELPCGMWAAWAGSQDSGHLDPTGGRLGAGQEDSFHIAEPHYAVQGVSEASCKGLSTLLKRSMGQYLQAGHKDRNLGLPKSPLCALPAQ